MRTTFLITCQLLLTLLGLSKTTTINSTARVDANIWQHSKNDTWLPLKAQWFLNKTSFQIQMNQIHCCKKNVYEIDESMFRTTWWVGWNVLNNFDVRKVAWQYSDLSIRLADLSRRSLGEWPLFWRLFVWQLVSIDSRRYFDDPRIWITEPRRAARKKSAIVNSLQSTII